jgi:hypothetical protein
MKVPSFCFFCSDFVEQILGGVGFGEAVSDETDGLFGSAV